MQHTRFEPLGYGVGTLLNKRYELLRKIGSGGMSAVYEAMDKALNNERVAVKIFSPSLTTEPQLIERFYNEVLITRKLTHPNIVRTFEFAPVDRGGGFLMTMELVNGVNLDQIIQGAALHDKPSFGEIVRILLEVCKGIAYAHQMGVVHRDLKPANILISDKSEVKIADFGLARAVVFADKQLTQAGECVGTPYYMAPEQIQEQQVDNRADIYSIGIIGYEMVTGHPPFQDESWFQLASKIIKDPMPDFPRKIRPPAWYRQFVLKAAAKDPNARFVSAQELIALLEMHTNSESTFALDVHHPRDARRADAMLLSNQRKGFRLPDLNYGGWLLAVSIGCLIMLILSSLTERAGSSIDQTVSKGITVMDKVEKTASDLRAVVTEVLQHQDQIQRQVDTARKDLEHKAEPGDKDKK